MYIPHRAKIARIFLLMGKIIHSAMRVKLDESASSAAHADSSGARRVYAGQMKTMRAVFWGSYLTGST